MIMLSIDCNYTLPHTASHFLVCYAKCLSHDCGGCAFKKKALPLPNNNH